MRGPIVPPYFLTVLISVTGPEFVKLKVYKFGLWKGQHCSFRGIYIRKPISFLPDFLQDKNYHKRNSKLYSNSLSTYTTEYIFYCKRAILFLSSSRIFFPPPATKAGGTHSPGGEGDGGSIFWKTREIGLPSYSKICTM